MTDACPTWPTLLAWLENDLPEEESRLLNTHVADCEGPTHTHMPIPETL